MMLGGLVADDDAVNSDVARSGGRETFEEQHKLNCVESIYEDLN